MSAGGRLPPHLGGPGARWVQLLLFALHVALIVSIGVLAALFVRIQTRVRFEPWQTLLFAFGLALTFVVFTWRGVRIGLDLWRAVRGEEEGPDEGEER